MKKFNLHLVSDSTCDTLLSMSRSSVSHFEGIKSEEFMWAFVRSIAQVDEIISEAKDNENSFIMYTLVSSEIRQYLKKCCYDNNIPIVAPLSSVIKRLSNFLGIDPHGVPGRHHMMTNDYFERIEIMNYTLSHDDGQNLHDVDAADIILIGISRSSKTPLSIYLANRGYRVSNIPFVPEVEFPIDMKSLSKGQFIIGLEMDADRLVQVRKNRFNCVGAEDYGGNYTDLINIENEIALARKFFLKHNIRTFNVTKHSVEETATMIIQLYLNQYKKS